MSATFSEAEMKINLTDDQIDDVVLYEMLRHSKMLGQSISSLNRKKKLKEYEKEDRARFKEVHTSMKVLLGYYGSHIKKIV